MVAPLPDPHFGRPLPGRIVIGSGWGPREDRMHLGIDVKAVTGTPVLSIGPGEVIRAQKHDTDAAGIHVAIRHPNGLISRYLHFSRLDVNLGDPVSQGQQLGLSGNTGRSSGPHLHFEMRAPKELLPAIEATVGKPTTGWGSLMSKYGYGIPAESWIPIDEFRASTLVKLKKYGVVLYGEREPTVPLAKISSRLKIAGLGILTGFVILIGVGLHRRRGF